jgi:uncharacterized protein
MRDEKEFRQMTLITAGFEAIIDYVTLHRVISLLIAFLLSGAIASFMSQGSVLKHFGPDAKPVMAYGVASLSGVILSVCSCSVLPMFSSIRKKGAGIGPAVTFLFAGPAINILAITMSFSLLGTDIGMVRLVSAVVLSVVIGLMMALLWSKHEKVDANSAMFARGEAHERETWKTVTFFALMVLILISGVKNPIPTSILAVILGVVVVLWFRRDEIKGWLMETWKLVYKIAPLFIVGIFVAGIIEEAIPAEAMARLVGTGSVLSNFVAATFGAFMYFATLTEVPIVQSFMSLGMLKGPAIALLLAGPSLSLPNMIVIGRVMGWKRALTYVGLTVVFATFAGYIAGLLFF